MTETGEGIFARNSVICISINGMKKVLFVTSISGFLPQFEKNDVKILQNMGCEVHLASNFNNPVYAFTKNDIEEMGVITHHIDIEKSPFKFAANRRAVRQIKEIIDNENINMIHCHNPMGGINGRRAAKKSKVKPYVIYTAHGFHFYKGAPLINWLLFYPIEKKYARITDTLITINEEDFERAHKMKIRKNNRLYQIHSVGVDAEKFSVKNEIAAKKRREINIPENGFHIVTAAELNKNKNQKTIIEALVSLSNKNVYYSICGKGSNDAKLKKLIKKHHMDDNIRLLGYRTDMEEVLQTADCFAFPSYREGLGVAAVEALLCGVPIIVSDNRGTREYAIDGSNAIVCKASDSKGFANAINNLYENRNLLGEMSSKCRDSAGKFAINEVEKTMIKIYEEALSS